VHHSIICEPASVRRCGPYSVTDRLYSRHRADTWRRKMNQTKHAIIFFAIGIDERLCHGLR